VISGFAGNTSVSHSIDVVGEVDSYNICTDRYGRGIIGMYETQQIPEADGTSSLLRYR